MSDESTASPEIKRDAAIYRSLVAFGGGCLGAGVALGGLIYLWMILW